MIIAGPELEDFGLSRPNLRARLIMDAYRIRFPGSPELGPEPRHPAPLKKLNFTVNSHLRPSRTSRISVYYSRNLVNRRSVVPSVQRLVISSLRRCFTGCSPTHGLVFPGFNSRNYLLGLRFGNFQRERVTRVFFLDQN